MQSALQPYATAGVAIVGASLIAVTPVAAPLPDVHELRDVALTAGGATDPFIEQFNTASESASLLYNNHSLAPHVGWQQILFDHNGFVQSFLDNPSALPTLVATAQENAKSVMSAFTLLDADSATVSTTHSFTLGGEHSLLVSELPGFLPSSINAETVTSIVNFLSSPASGMMIGLLGPLISPWISLGNSISDHDGLSATLVNFLGAFFNGATLNLDGVLPTINDSGFLPAPMEITSLSFAFGGLLSTGEVGAGPWHLYGETGSTIATVPAVGGSLLNSLGVDLVGVPLLNNLDLTAHPLGPIGAAIGWSELVGQLLGTDWNGKNKPATPPGVLTTFPTIPDTVSGGTDSTAAATAGTDLMNQLGDGLTQLLSGAGFSDIF